MKRRGRSRLGRVGTSLPAYFLVQVVGESLEYFALEVLVFLRNPYPVNHRPVSLHLVGDLPVGIVLGFGGIAALVGSRRHAVAFSMPDVLGIEPAVRFPVDGPLALVLSAVKPGSAVFLFGGRFRPLPFLRRGGV